LDESIKIKNKKAEIENLNKEEKIPVALRRIESLKSFLSQ
jgi:hypothetical protein